MRVGGAVVITHRAFGNQVTNISEQGFNRHGRIAQVPHISKALVEAAKSFQYWLLLGLAPSAKCKNGSIHGFASVSTTNLLYGLQHGSMSMSNSEKHLLMLHIVACKAWITMSTVGGRNDASTPKMA